MTFKNGTDRLKEQPTYLKNVKKIMAYVGQWVPRVPISSSKQFVLSKQFSQLGLYMLEELPNSSLSPWFADFHWLNVIK